MQIPQSLFQKKDGCPQPQCDGPLHGHGCYSRYATPDGDERFEVSRYCCTRCGLTVSVLAEGRLPYRPVSALELEADFDRKAGKSGTAPPDGPPGEKKSGCFDRAWTAWVRNSRRIAELMGHLLPRSASGDAAQCWRSLRETSSITGILAMLWTRFKTSLLKAYRCLKPGVPRAAAVPG